MQLKIYLAIVAWFFCCVKIKRFFFLKCIFFIYLFIDMCILDSLIFHCLQDRKAFFPDICDKHVFALFIVLAQCGRRNTNVQYQRSVLHYK